MKKHSQELAFVFRAVGDALKDNRDELNQCDLVNGNHGDQMVRIFEIVTMTISRLSGASVYEAMSAAAGCLEKAKGNEKSLTYAHGLAEIAEQLRQNDISFEDLIYSVKNTLGEDESYLDSKTDTRQTGKKGQVIKSLLAGLIRWNQVEDGLDKTEKLLDFGELMRIGVTYMQAKQRNQKRIDILADAVASASPLGNDQCTYRSGMIVMKALLQSIQEIPV